VQDTAGNDSLAATQFSIVFDGTAPTPAITSTATNPTSVSPIPISVNFGEVVSGFTVEDLVVAGGTVGNFQDAGGGLFTFDITPTGDGIITVDIAAGAAEDAAGNDSPAATQFSIEFVIPDEDGEDDVLAALASALAADDDDPDAIDEALALVDDWTDAA
jgi:hypothetical protein